LRKFNSKIDTTYEIWQMTEENATTTLPAIRHWHWEWIFPFLVRPRKIFARIVAQTGSNWQVPLLLLILAALAEVTAAGYVRQLAAAAGEITIPPGFEYYTPEQQAQFMQAMSATSSPAFLYVLPGIWAVIRVIAGWLLVASILHLLLTLLGGRGDTGAILNVVAWAGLPFVIRSLVRTGAIFLTRSLISSPGLAGFVSATSENLGLFLTALFSLIDIFLIWHVILLFIGIRTSTNLSWIKVVTATAITMLIILSIQALLSFGIARLGNLTVIRPFF
jgi:hypothetical protein